MLCIVKTCLEDKAPARAEAAADETASGVAQPVDRSHVSLLETEATGGGTCACNAPLGTEEPEQPELTPSLKGMAGRIASELCREVDHELQLSQREAFAPCAGSTSLAMLWERLAHACDNAAFRATAHDVSSSSTDESLEFVAELHRRSRQQRFGMACAEAPDQGGVLLVTGIERGGSVEQWNDECAQSQMPWRRVHRGAAIFSVNGVQGVCAKMREELSRSTDAVLVACNPRTLNEAVVVLRTVQAAAPMPAESGPPFWANRKLRAPALEEWWTRVSADQPARPRSRSSEAPADGQGQGTVKFGGSGGAVPWMPSAAQVPPSPGWSPAGASSPAGQAPRPGAAGGEEELSDVPRGIYAPEAPGTASHLKILVEQSSPCRASSSPTPGWFDEAAETVPGQVSYPAGIVEGLQPRVDIVDGAWTPSGSNFAWSDDYYSPPGSGRWTPRCSTERV